MDTFIQEFFFNHATQVALVIDPRSGDEGIFVWKTGAIERVPRFWVGSVARACAVGPVNQRPAVARAPAARPAATAPGAAPMAAAAPAHAHAHDDDDHAASDELDIFGGIQRLFAENWPSMLCLLLGFLVARYLFTPFEVASMQKDVLRTEVRDLLTATAGEWAVSEDLRHLRERVDGAIAITSQSPANVGQVQGELMQTSREMEALRRIALVREKTIRDSLDDRLRAGISLTDEVRALEHDAKAARQLALASIIQSLRTRIELLSALGPLPDRERIRFRAELEATLQLEPDERFREAVRLQFPDLYPPAPAPVASQAPAPPGEKK
jgi:hypothetical protein